jgi:hypothetical protein
MSNLIILPLLLPVLGPAGEDARKAAALKEPNKEDLVKLIEEAGGGSWPGRGESLGKMVPKAAVIVVGKAREKAERVKNYAAHISTAMDIGGRTVRGGGMVFYSDCRQRFDISAVLHGEGKKGERVVTYGVRKSQAFPGPGSVAPIPEGATAILLLDKGGEVLMALPDTVENRAAVRKAIGP